MKTVMIFGTFDIVHAGHISLFKQARALGDHVIAVVARDARIQTLKATERVHSESERVELLQHIDLIDYVVLGDENDVYKVIRDNAPDIIALGYDQHHYVDGLAKLKKEGLSFEIVRLQPHKDESLKSSRIKEKLSVM